MLDINKAPYFNDYDFKNNFKHILFKAGLPVQTRELNQIQSIFRGELGSLSDHIFKNGSKVSNCRTNLFRRDYVRLMEKDSNDNFLSDPNFKAKLVGETSEVEAVLTNFIPLSESDSYTINVIYTKTGKDNKQNTFLHGEWINVISADGLVLYKWQVRCPDCVGSTLSPEEIKPTGYSYYFSVDEGIVYFKQMFIHVNQQEILIQKYVNFDNNAKPISDEKFKVGLDISIEIINAYVDERLFDNSLGYPNASAEGADRLKTSATLVKRSYNNEDGECFILFAKYRENFSPEYVKADSDYNDLMKEFARRTYESAGNFTVNPFLVSVLNEKKENEKDTKGFSLNGNNANYVAIVNPGIGYIQGYRVQKDNDTVVSESKPRETTKEDNFAVTLPPRQYIQVQIETNNNIINNAYNNIIIGNTDILLYDDVTSDGLPTGNQIGVAKVADQTIFKDNVYNIYLYDVNITNSNKSISDVKSIKTPTNSVVGNTVLVNDSTVLYNADSVGLIYQIPMTDIKSLRNILDPNSGSITIKVRRKLTGTLDANGKISFTSSNNEYFEGYNISDTLVTVDGISKTLLPNQYVVNNNTLSIDMTPNNAGKNIIIIVNVTKYEQTERTKVLVKKTFTTITKPDGIINSLVKLGFADVRKINHVKIVDPSQPSYQSIDITNEFEFNNGQTEIYYGESFLKRIKNRNDFVETQRLEISFDYFEHQGNQGYFTVDSYKQLLNDGVLLYEEIPSFKVNGKDLKLSECIDFRSIYMNGQYVNTPTIPVQNSTFVSDIEHYLPRIDIVQISWEGVITIKKGISSMNPIAPEPDIGNMKIYNIHMNAYVYNISKDIKLEYVDNRRFTMNDIGRIKNRLDDLEYYISLSQLEQTTMNDNILDTNGLSRYKNGFIVDDFSKFQAADINNKNFKASLDRKRGELRPFFNTYNIDMKINMTKSKNVNLAGNVAMLPFTEVVELTNPLATKSVSINPYLVFNRKGSLVLTPNIDTWADDEHLPNISTTIDAGVQALQDINSFNSLVGTDWGSWQNMNTTVQQSSSVIESTNEITRLSNGTNTRTTTSTNITTITNTDQQRNGISRSINSRTDTFTISDMVKDVRIIPYIRSKVIDFYASRMKPNTELRVLFDGVDVTKHCRIKRAIGNNELTTPLISDFGGSPLVTDENGEILGEFRIPAETFFTGEKEFVLTDSITQSSEPTTSANAKYFAGGVNQSKQNNSLNIMSPVINSINVSEQRTLRNVTNDTIVDIRDNFTPDPPPQTGQVLARMNGGTELVPMPPRPEGDWSSAWHWVVRNNTWVWDPIAQGFQVTESCFITTLEVFFQQVDTKTSDTIWFEIRTMVNGYPSSEAITHKDYSVHDIANFVSNDSTKGFKVFFDQPIYVDSNKSYCFVIGGNSPDTKVWVSRLGEEVVNVKGKIVEEPPSLNASFRSLNGSTWNAEQYEFIKYNLYRAQFSQREMNLVMNNDDVPDVKLKTFNPIEVEKGINRVRIYAENHGATVNDKVSISFFENLPIQIKVSNNTPPQIGQILKTPTGSGKIASVDSTSIINEYIVTLTHVVGDIIKDQFYQCDPIVKKFNDFVLFANGNTPQKGIQITECQGTIISDIRNELGFTTIANVPISEFNKEFTIVEVDSVNSFIIEVPGTFTESGRYGRTQVSLYGLSRKFESYTISGEYLSYTCIEKNSLKTYDLDYNIQRDTVIETGVNTYSAKPLKLASKVNEKRVLGSENSLELTMNFYSNSDRISPMINLDTIAFTGVSNMVENITLDKFNVSPNKDNRYVSELFDNGSESYRYITQKVVLKNPASDIRIYADVYKDVDADFDIYIKLGNGDTVSDEQNSWILLDNINKSSISTGINNFIEHEFNLSTDYSQYVEKDFIWFRIKIVGRTKNSAKPPMFRNFRAIALT